VPFNAILSQPIRKSSHLLQVSISDLFQVHFHRYSLGPEITFLDYSCPFAQALFFDSSHTLAIVAPTIEPHSFHSNFVEHAVVLNE
jgi:hypothetical protein